jgi:hypothetical protein
MVEVANLNGFSIKRLRTLKKLWERKRTAKMLIAST